MQFFTSMKGQIIPIVQLKGEFSKPSGVKDDNVEYIDYEEALLQYGNLSANGATIETIDGEKSLENPSTFTSSCYNGHILYSLPDKTCDTITVNGIDTNIDYFQVGDAQIHRITTETIKPISDVVVSILHKCEHISIDNTTPISEIIQSGDSRVADGVFAIEYSKEIFNEPITANSTNIYCNRLKISNQTALESITSSAIYINDSQGIYIILPTGTCEENETAVAEWLNSHNIEIIYPLAVPNIEEHSLNYDLSLKNYSTMDSFDISTRNTLTRNIVGGTAPYTCTYYTDGSPYEMGGITFFPHEEGSLDNNGDTFLLNLHTLKCEITVTDSNGNVNLKIFNSSIS